MDYKEYKFTYGQYKGKTLEEVTAEENGLKKIKGIRKNLIKFINNSSYDKYKEANMEELQCIDDFLNALENTNNTQNVTDIKEHETDKINSSSISEKGCLVNNELSSLDFSKLLEIFENKILEGYDEKFKKKRFIRKEYKDYLCLRYANIQYTKLLETQNKTALINIISNI